VRDLLEALWPHRASDVAAEGSVADASLREVDRLWEPARSFLFWLLARDIHILLLWGKQLGSPADDHRVQALFGLAAAASRRLDGQWPLLPGCTSPRQLACADMLSFNPLRGSVPPEAVSGGVLNARLLRWRPLAAMLVYKSPDAKIALTSFDDLVRAATSGLPAAPVAQTSSPDFSAWAAALTGSDVEDYVRLQNWRVRTYMCLRQGNETLKLRQLQAAISSRCLVVHCQSEHRRLEHQRSARISGAFAEQRLCGFVSALLRDFGESDCQAVLEEHHAAAKQLLPREGEKREKPSRKVLLHRQWAMRHILLSYRALRKLIDNLGAARCADAQLPLTPEARRSLAYLHAWFQNAGYLDDNAKAKRQAATIQKSASSVSWPDDAAFGFSAAAADAAAEPGAVTGRPALLAMEVAPPASSSDGCFYDTDLPELEEQGRVQMCMLDAAEGSPLEKIPEVAQVLSVGE